MSKKPIRVEVVQEGDDRLLLTIYDDKTEERTPILKTEKKRRNAPRPYWYWSLRTGRRKFF